MRRHRTARTANTVTPSGCSNIAVRQNGGQDIGPGSCGNANCVCKAGRAGLTVKWGPAFQHFGQKFDHGLVSTKWRWKRPDSQKNKQSNLSVMVMSSKSCLDFAC